MSTVYVPCEVARVAGLLWLLQSYVTGTDSKCFVIFALLCLYVYCILGEEVKRMLKYTFHWHDIILILVIMGVSFPFSMHT